VEEHIKKIFEYRFETVNGKLIYDYNDIKKNIDFINFMLYKHLCDEVSFIFDKAFYHYCKYSEKDENHIIAYEEDIRENLVVKYFNCEDKFTFNELLIFLQNILLDRLNIEEKFYFVKSIIFREKVFDFNAFIFFLKKDLNSIQMNDIKKANNQENFILNISFNPFIDKKYDIKKIIDELYYMSPIENLKINNKEYMSKVDRLKRIFEVYYLNQYIGIKSTRIIYKELRKKGYIFNNYMNRNDLSDLTIESNDGKHQVQLDLNYILNVQKLEILFDFKS